MFLCADLTQLRRAAAVVPVKGYFQWRAMGNFGWNNGFSVRYGLVYVDFKTRRRTPTVSAAWFCDETYCHFVLCSPLLLFRPQPCVSCAELGSMVLDGYWQPWYSTLWYPTAVRLLLLCYVAGPVSLRSEEHTSELQ